MSGEVDGLEKLDLRVKQVMTRNPLTVDAESTVDVAASGMESCGCGCCLVESRGKIVGIITERDIVRRVSARMSSPKRVKVKSIMTSKLIAIHPDATVEQALQTMAENKIRRLPVVDRKGLVGVVSIVDIAKALAEKSGYTSSLINAIARQSPPPEGLYT